jgi:hypothetical protein
LFPPITLFRRVIPTHLGRGDEVNNDDSPPPPDNGDPGPTPPLPPPRDAGDDDDRIGDRDGGSGENVSL